MAYSVKILADSIAIRGKHVSRLTTMEVTLPRIVLAEFNTHRVFSRNSASSRAIPVEKRIAAIELDPFEPEAFGKNQKGMQASEDLRSDDDVMARMAWRKACADAVSSAKVLASLGVHKQLANRLIEPFCWHTIIVSSTEWDNYFGLRLHPDAQPEIRKPTGMMWEEYQASKPKELKPGEWHLPLLQPDEFVLPDDSPEWNDPIGFSCTQFRIDDAKRISVGRCARVSYLTHDGRRDPMADIELSARLHASGHMSPFEHVARPLTNQDIIERKLSRTAPFVGNFRGWLQFRKELANEDNFKKVLDTRVR